MQVGVAHRLEIGAVCVQQARQGFGHLGALPGGPDAVRGERDGSADHGEQGAGRDELGGRHSGAGEEQDHQGGERGRPGRRNWPGRAQRIKNMKAAMNNDLHGGVGEMAWKSAVASARPVKVPARRRTPRLKVVVKSGLSTMATVMGAQ